MVEICNCDNYVGDVFIIISFLPYTCTLTSYTYMYIRINNDMFISRNTL